MVCCRALPSKMSGRECTLRNRTRHNAPSLHIEWAIKIADAFPSPDRYTRGAVHVAYGGLGIVQWQIEAIGLIIGVVGSSGDLKKLAHFVN